jgi:hypothetical protein
MASVFDAGKWKEAARGLDPDIRGALETLLESSDKVLEKINATCSVEFKTAGGHTRAEDPRAITGQ